MKSVLVFQAWIVLVLQCRNIYGQMIPTLEDAFVDPAQSEKSKKNKKKQMSESQPPSASSTKFNINSLRSRGESLRGGSSKAPKKGQFLESMAFSQSSDVQANSTTTRPFLDRLRAKKKSGWRKDDDDDDDSDDDTLDISRSDVKFVLSILDATDGNSTFLSFFKKKGKKGTKGKKNDDDDDDDAGLSKWFGKKLKGGSDDPDDSISYVKSGKKKKRGFSDFFGSKSSKGEKNQQVRGSVAPSISPAPAGPPMLPLNQNVLPSFSRPTLPQFNVPSPPVAIPVTTNAPTLVPTGEPLISTPAPTTMLPTTEVPSFSPTSEAPSNAPTSNAPSSAPTEARTCVPTVGPCLETVQSIQAAFDASSGGDTIAICADVDAIVVDAALVLRQPNTTLCCFNETADRTCTLQSQGRDNTLDVSGASVRLKDLVFENGIGAAGGNTVIDADGDHVIDGCDFRSGRASRLGGNLFVSADGGSLHIRGSTFVDGVAGEMGGGIYIVNAQEITIENSIFQRNNVTDVDSSGGGIFMVFDNDTAPGLMATFRDTDFFENEADLGGGFFATQLGEMPRLDVIGCTFADNIARQAAGAGAIAQSLDNFDFRIESSVGRDNSAPICEDFLGFFDDSTEPECIAAGRMYPP